MIEYPLTGSRLIALEKITYGKKVINKCDVVEIENVGFIDNDKEDFSGIYFTIKGFAKVAKFPIESPYFEELEDNPFNEEILKWNS